MKTKPTQTKPVSSVEAELQIRIAAPQARVWKALVSETTAWWPKDFYASSATKQFVIEPRLGGRVYEDAGGEQGIIWYSVIGVEKPNFLLLAGFLAPPFAGPATSLLRLALSAPSKTETLLEVTDAAFGCVADCNTAEGWSQIFDAGLRGYVEGAGSSK